MEPPVADHSAHQAPFALHAAVSSLGDGVVSPRDVRTGLIAPDDRSVAYLQAIAQRDDPVQLGPPIDGGS